MGRVRVWSQERGSQWLTTQSTSRRRLLPLPKPHLKRTLKIGRLHFTFPQGSSLHYSFITRSLLWYQWDWKQLTRFTWLIRFISCSYHCWWAPASQDVLVDSKSTSMKLFRFNLPESTVRMWLMKSDGLDYRGPSYSRSPKIPFQGRLQVCLSEELGLIDL